MSAIAPYWKLVLRTVKRARRHDCMGVASQAAFGAILSIVPAFISLVALTSTVGLSEETLQFVVSTLADILPAGTLPFVDLTVRTALEHPAPRLFTTGLLVTLWSASGMLATYMKGINRAFGVRPRFAYWRDRFLSLALVFIVVFPLSIASFAALFGQQLGHYVADALALGPFETLFWSLTRWTVTFVVVILVVSLVYLIGSSERLHPMNVVPGAVVATALWAVGTIGFNLMTANGLTRFGSYGGLTAVVIFLFWVQLSSLAFLVGAELNAELVDMRSSTPNRPNYSGMA